MSGSVGSGTGSGSVPEMEGVCDGVPNRRLGRPAPLLPPLPAATAAAAAFMAAWGRAVEVRADEPPGVTARCVGRGVARARCGYEAEAAREWRLMVRGRSAEEPCELGEGGGRGRN